MFIRSMVREDVPRVAAITNVMFEDDELHRWLYPRRSLHPDDLRRYHVIRIRSRFVEAGCHGFVMVSEEGDEGWTGKSEVLGFAFFMRKGDDPAGKKLRSSSLFNKLDFFLTSVEQAYEVKFLCRINEPDRLKKFIEQYPVGIYKALDPRWHVGILGVAPEHQRRGIGGKLLRHGLNLAREENIPMTLEASDAGRGLYLRSGFKIIEDLIIEEGVESCAMAWEPESSRGKWIKDIGDQRGEIIDKAKNAV